MCYLLVAVHNDLHSVALVLFYENTVRFKVRNDCRSSTKNRFANCVLLHIANVCSVSNISFITKPIVNVISKANNLEQNALVPLLLVHN